MKNVVVTGANGQLAQCLKDVAQTLDANQYEFTFVSRDELDISKSDKIAAYFNTKEIDCVVNCAAYTAVDLAEKEVDKAYQVNAEAVGNLAKKCAEKNSEFIHISTDYVFEGNATNPIKVEDYTHPLSVYGKSKLLGEKLALENNPNSIIIRTAWVYSQYGKNFMKTMLRLFAEKNEISVVNDQKGTPTNANDIAKAILKIIQTEQKTPGIFHFTNAGETTWFGFAEAIKKFTNSDIIIHPIPTSEFPTPAKRPVYSVLDISKIQEVYGVASPNWKDSLKSLLDKF